MKADETMSKMNSIRINLETLLEKGKKTNDPKILEDMKPLLQEWIDTSKEHTKSMNLLTGFNN